MTKMESKMTSFSPIRDDVTGSHYTQGKIVVFPFGKYEVTIKVSDSNEFEGVVEIKVNKDFKAFKEKSTPVGYHDVEQYYRE
ncbi:MAG: hypothetical protein L0Y74_10625 [candidate division Zixibacteria bacterium]|nr:hypothetical protein [candidate division Zixibacteria bacterium]